MCYLQNMSLEIFEILLIHNNINNKPILTLNLYFIFNITKSIEKVKFNETD